MALPAINGLALFAGAGGLELGLRLALGDRFHTVCVVEREAYAAAVLVARMAEGRLDPAAVWDDVVTFDGCPWRGVVDVVSGGFPCQDISNAGRREGIEGARSGLWSEYARIVREVGPRFVFVENVAALVVRGLDRVLSDLSALGSMRSGMCFEHPTSERPTGGNGSSFSRGLYPTPTAEEYGSAQNGIKSEQPSGGTPSLSTWAANLWPTPMVRNGQELDAEVVAAKGTTPEGKKQIGLESVAKFWPTPKASEECGERYRPETTVRHFEEGRQITLSQFARDIWATPMAQDGSSADVPVNGHLGRQVLQTSTDGGGTSKRTRVLNPLFVEALMGWPTGWTACGSSETEWCRSRPLSPSASLPTASASQPL